MLVFNCFHKNFCNIRVNNHSTSNTNISPIMTIFGLTGGIASGKSTISRTFLKHGIPTVDADIVARQVVEPGTPGLAAIVDVFGQDILLPDGTMNRARVSEQVFSNPDLIVRKRLMSKLNAIMAPLVQQESARQLNKLQAEGHAMVGYDAALICEMGNAERYRPLIVVYCPTEVQCERLMSRNSLTRDRAMDIISIQMPIEAKARLADRVIYTWGNIDQSVLQTEHCIEWLKRLNKNP
jgi:dephospho-CoA kinase